MVQNMLVSYCGLYCDLCGARNDTPERARALVTTLKQSEIDHWGADIPDFPEFWRFLNSLTEIPADKCCRSGQCGAPNCAIRNCAKDREVEVCAFCADFPCDRIRVFAQSEPLLLHDGERIRKVGLEQWVAEQIARREAGFDYGRVRCLPCIVPTE
ncbi:MAG: DUF3795 domain-containing protein [Anaerolineae bacterium]|jgi:hypothetical protein|nr:DUF3795 domain-containing protein [Anaerolineae bacterium]